MRTKKFVIAMLCAASVATGFTSVAHAGVNLNIDIGVPPPERRYEPVPAPREGFVWVEGYWGWNGRRHEWVEGRWEPVRRGYVYRQPQWVHEGERWKFREGYWEERRHEEHWEDHDRHEGHDHDRGRDDH